MMFACFGRPKKRSSSSGQSDHSYAKRWSNESGTTRVKTVRRRNLSVMVEDRTVTTTTNDGGGDYTDGTVTTIVKMNTASSECVIVARQATSPRSIGTFNDLDSVIARLGAEVDTNATIDLGSFLPVRNYSHSNGSEKKQQQQQQQPPTTSTPRPTANPAPVPIPTAMPMPEPIPVHLPTPQPVPLPETIELDIEHSLKQEQAPPQSSQFYEGATASMGRSFLSPSKALHMFRNLNSAFSPRGESALSRSAEKETL